MRNLSVSLFALMIAGPAMAQSASDDAVDQLIGQWQYRACQDANGEACTTVERTFEATEEDELLYYTETVGGETYEGFVGYDAQSNSFYEYDYPQDWSRDQFERSYSGEQASADLFGEDLVGRDDQVLRWQLNETGESMTLRSPGGTIEEENPAEFLGVIFSRVPIVGSDPIIGGE